MCNRTCLSISVSKLLDPQHVHVRKVYMFWPDLTHVLLHAHLQHAAIDRIEEELQSKREKQKELADTLVAMDEEFSKERQNVRALDTEISAVASQLQKTAHQVNTLKTM